DTREEEAEFEQCGRVTGYFEAFTSPDERTIVSTGAHLFTSEAGATGYLARFAERYKRLAGGTIGRQRVVAVSQLTVPRLGDTATAVALELPDRQRITVLVRRGRVIGETLVVNGDGARARTEAFELSRKLDDRIAGALR
ncbi:MAG TPA: hypothetical protein VFM93_01745, partial [Candidatus Limnocylindria bacterium]|nr:hypothetical protein [Candidatus Limnocylindria bacterium]